MFDKHTVELDWGGRKLTLETGKVARQADGAVVATYGETTVLATVVAAKSAREGVDFLPLTVDYQEKYYAAGRIPGGYFKREGRPTEKETLVCRLIDRPIRPLFADGWRNETQVIVTTLSHDMENDPDILALVATSAALTLSGVPFMGPIGAARVGFINGEYVLNPLVDEMADSELDLVVAGTADAVLMVESEAKELPEDVMLGAVMFGHRHFQPVIQAIIQLAEKAAKEPRDVKVIDNSAIEQEMLKLFEKDLRSAYSISKKQDRYAAVGAVKEKMLAHFFPEGAEPKYDKLRIAGVFKELEAKIVRWNILDTSKRIDGRDLSTVRPIMCEVGVLPRTHGSALFTRGETQALVVTTLGTGEDEQWIDALQGTYKEHFLLHYNFPPYSVGETGRIGGTKRREIGHGKLAWRAVHPVLPAKHEFPYTIRVVSEVTESNGSSSMATVCGSSLALMDAGVPLKRPIAGIAMGLIREVIGTGGKVIREIVEKTGAKINVEDDGTVKVASANGDSIRAAIKWIKSIASDPEVGQIYDGTIVKVMDFGAFVNFFGSKDDLVHISQLAQGRVQKTSDVVKEGDKVKVKLLGFDDRGKTRLSMKVVDQETGEDLEAKQKTEREPEAAAGGAE